MPTSEPVLLIPEPGRLVPRSRSLAAVRVMVACWAFLSAAVALFAFVCTTAPVRYPAGDSEIPSGPSWIPSGLFLLLLLLTVVVAVSMPVLLAVLLVVGLCRLRRVAHGGWSAGWAGVLAAAAAMEVAFWTDFSGPRVSESYTGPAVVDWAHLVDAAGFLAVGGLMLGVLAAACRSWPRRGLSSGLQS